MKQYLTCDSLRDSKLSDDELFEAITDNTGRVEITPLVKKLFYDVLHHPRILFFDEGVDRLDAQRDGLVCGSSSSYLTEMSVTIDKNEFYLIIWGIYSYSMEGLIVGYCIAKPNALLSLHRKKLIDEYLIELE